MLRRNPITFPAVLGKSEFVAPVMMKGVLVGELDIDSHTKAAFEKEDAAFLGWVADITAPAVAGAAGLGE